MWLIPCGRWTWGPRRVAGAARAWRRRHVIRFPPARHRRASAQVRRSHRSGSHPAETVRGARPSCWRHASEVISHPTSHLAPGRAQDSQAPGEVRRARRRLRPRYAGFTWCLPSARVLRRASRRLPRRHRYVTADMESPPGRRCGVRPTVLEAEPVVIDATHDRQVAWTSNCRGPPFVPWRWRFPAQASGRLRRRGAERHRDGTRPGDDRDARVLANPEAVAVALEARSPRLRDAARSAW
jgi:hypothetical protein